LQAKLRGLHVEIGILPIALVSVVTGTRKTTKTAMITKVRIIALLVMVAERGRYDLTALLSIAFLSNSIHLFSPSIPIPAT